MTRWRRTAAKDAAAALSFLAAVSVVLVGLGAAARADDGPIRIAIQLFPSFGSGNPYQAYRLPTIFPTLAVFDPLTVVRVDGTVEPWLAVSWSSDDAKVWSVTLREGVRFSNGEPLTSDALVASHAHMSSTTGLTETIGSNLALIDSVRAISDLDVEIALKHPDAFFPFRMALWKIPEPKSWASAVKEQYAEVVAGTGPFMMRSAIRTEFVMEPNPFAWNPPQASGMVFTLIPEQLARVQALTAKRVDFAIQIGLSDRASVEAMGARLIKRPAAQVQYVAFAKEHFDETPIADPRIRQALNYGVNRDAIGQIIFEGMVEPIGQLLQPGAPGHVANLSAYPFDPERAKALLTDAGYAEGLDLTMRVAPAGPDDFVVFQQIANDLAKVGVNLTLQQAPVGSMTVMLFNGDFKGAELFAMASRGLDTLGDYRIRSCLGLTGQHEPFFCDDENLKTYTAARAASTFDEAASLTQQAIRREFDNPPGIFLWPLLALDAASSSVDEGDNYTRYYDFIPLHQLSRTK